MDINPFSKIFSYKHIAYEYEKEVRAIIDRFDDDIDDEMESGIYVKISPNQLLRSIVISPESPVWFKQMMREIVKKYNCGVKPRRSLYDIIPL